MPADLIQTAAALTGQNERTRAFTQQYDLEVISKALEAAGFTINDEVQLLVDGMKHPEMKIRLKAQAQWRAFLREIRLASTVFLSMVRRDDGSTEQSASAIKLLNDLEQENLSAPQRKKIAHEYHPPAPPKADIDPRAQIQRIQEALLGSPIKRPPGHPDAADAIDHQDGTPSWSSGGPWGAPSDD